MRERILSAQERAFSYSIANLNLKVYRIFNPQIVALSHVPLDTRTDNREDVFDAHSAGERR